MKFILCLLLLTSCTIFSKEKNDNFEYKLCVAAIFQNEADYLHEWIEYHYHKGVEHFFLYNNNSEDNFHRVLNPWIDADMVTLIEWPSKQDENDWQHFTFTVQCGAYNDAINRCRGVSKWLALIDTDEFIYAVNHYSIIDLLENEYPHVSGLCINWQCYGTSQKTLKAGESLLENLTMKMKWNHDWNKNSKTICQPNHVLHCNHPHYCIYTNNHWAISSDFVRCDACCLSVDISKVRINHYWTRDEHFFWKTKIKRYRAWGVDTKGSIEHASIMNEEYDPILLEWR